MLFNMDTELQHLISISVDKMTSETDSSLADRGSPKSGGMDLRKALLVAHFLQEVRQAYFEENYSIVLNTFSKMDYNKNEDLSHSCYCNLYKENLKQAQDPIDFQVSQPHRDSIFPSCVTNSEVVVSKISQVTRPFSVSVNTNHVICCSSSPDQSDLKKGKSDVDDGDDLLFCDELDVSSCCEVVSCASDDHVVGNAEADSRDHVTSTNRGDGRSGNETHAEDEAVAARESPRSACGVPYHARNHVVTSSPAPESCSLPKKKRPLPSEYLELSTVKTAKVESDEDPCSHRSLEGEEVVNSGFSRHTSIAHTIILESRTSTSLSTVCSVIGRLPLNENFRRSPKVVVQLTQSCDSYLPITCAHMEKRLNNITAQAF